MTQQSKLLFFVNHMDCFWTRRFPIAKQAEADGYRVSVCAKGAASDPKLEDYPFTNYDLPEAGRGLAGVITGLKIVAEMRRVIRKDRPDIIHAMTLKYAFMAGLACLFIKDVKVVHTIAGLGYLFSGEGLKPKLLRLVIGPFLKIALNKKRSFLTFQNPDDMGVLVNGGYARQENSFLIKGSGISLDEYAYTPEPEREKLLVVMPTRLIHEKGISVFIDACNILTARGVEADYQIAGGGAPYNPREISTEEMHAMLEGSSVEWLGHVDNIAGLYRKCNMIVYTSHYGEGLPKVLLEAASTGRAIITTDHPGCREAIVHGETGFLVPIKDPEACADAMEILITDEKKRHQMSKAARKLAENEFSVERVVALTLDVYKVAIAC